MKHREKKTETNEQSISELWGKSKEDGGQKKIFDEIVAEIFPNLMQSIPVNCTPSTRNMWKTTSQRRANETQNLQKEGNNKD